MTVKLECPLSDYDALAAAVDKTRRGSKTVTVDRDALAALLRDHGKLTAAAVEAKIKLEEPK